MASKPFVPFRELRLRGEEVCICECPVHGRLTEEQFAAMQKRVKGSADATSRTIGYMAVRGSEKPTASPYRSKLEAAYANKLEMEKRAGTIKGWLYEPFSFKLAEGKRYRVDFVTWGIAGVECIEVKGKWVKNRRDGMTHLHWAAQRFPFFIWRLVWRSNNGWDGRDIIP